MSAALAQIGRSIRSMISVVGAMTVLLVQILRSFFPLACDSQQTWRAFYKVGVKGFPIVVLTALFTGAIMVIQSGHYVNRTGATSLLGWAAGFAVFAEIGPILIGLMFSGRVGANNTAELDSMVVTEQVDALRSLAINPINYLVAPRFLAMTVMLFLLTAMGDLFALVGGAATAKVMLDVPMEVFFQQVVDAQLLDEYWLGLIKGTVFGMSIAVVSCHFGLRASGGAAGVGRAVNASVVAAAIGIFVTDYIVALVWGTV